MMSDLKDRMQCMLPKRCIVDYSIPWAADLDGDY